MKTCTALGPEQRRCTKPVGHEGFHGDPVDGRGFINEDPREWSGYWEGVRTWGGRSTTTTTSGTGADLVPTRAVRLRGSPLHLN